MMNNTLAEAINQKRVVLANNLHLNICQDVELNSPLYTFSHLPAADFFPTNLLLINVYLYITNIRYCSFHMLIATGDIHKKPLRIMIFQNNKTE